MAQWKSASRTRMDQRISAGNSITDADAIVGLSVSTRLPQIWVWRSSTSYPDRYGNNPLRGRCGGPSDDNPPGICLGVRIKPIRDRSSLFSILIILIKDATDAGCERRW